MDAIERLANAINNGDTREACRLVEAALTVAALGTMFSTVAVQGAAQHLRYQASCVSDDAEKTLLAAIADYLDNAAKN